MDLFMTTVASIVSGVTIVLLGWIAHQLSRRVTPEQLEAAMKPLQLEQKRLSEMHEELDSKIEKLPSADRFNLELQRRDDEQKRTNERLKIIENKVDLLPEKLGEIVKSAIKSGGK